MVVVFKIKHFGCLDIIIFVFSRDDEMEGLLEISTDDGFALAALSGRIRRDLRQTSDGTRLQGTPPTHHRRIPYTPKPTSSNYGKHVLGYRGFAYTIERRYGGSVLHRGRLA